MPITINGSGTITGASTLATAVVSPTLTTPNINSASVPTVSGTAPLYMARAWVNFDGTGTPAILASGNVSSITDNGTGDYTINFTTALVDVNYSAVVNSSLTSGGISNFVNVFSTSLAVEAPTTSAFRFTCIRRSDGTALDPTYLCASVFR